MGHFSCPRVGNRGKPQIQVCWPCLEKIVSLKPHESFLGTAVLAMSATVCWMLINLTGKCRSTGWSCKTAFNAPYIFYAPGAFSTWDFPNSFRKAMIHRIELSCMICPSWNICYFFYTLWISYMLPWGQEQQLLRSEGQKNKIKILSWKWLPPSRPNKEKWAIWILSAVLCPFRELVLYRILLHLILSFRLDLAVIFVGAEHARRSQERVRTRGTSYGENSRQYPYCVRVVLALVKPKIDPS